MKLTHLISTAVAVASTADAIAIPNPFEERRDILNERALIAVTGLTDGNSGRFRPYRQEINNFIKNGDQLNLYLIALQAMQQDSYSNPLSYYQISGIHGRPYVGWNGESATGYPQTGYCTHASILFPTWHRPYLALYEQTLHAKMAYLVSKFPSSSRARWQAALNGFRLPYWDWATHNGQMPSIVGTQQTVVVTKWDNKQYTIPNPLYSYTFAQGTGGSNGPLPTYPFYQWPNTLRYPTSNDPNAVSQPNLVNQQLGSNAGSLAQRVYQVLVNQEYSDYKTFSNKNAQTGASDSLEAIHDVIHGLTGNGGHMSYIDYSAFDPIFYLHHTNIDRLFAIWQALNPNSWISSQVNPYGTYGIPPGTNENSGTSLTPFQRTNGAFWNSNQVRSTYTLGYAYPETGYWKYSSTASYQAAVRRSVNSLYGGTQAQIASSAAAAKKRDTDPSGNATQTAINSSVMNNKYFDWKINVQVNKMAAGGSFFIHFFLGAPSSNPKDWSFQKNLIGDYAVFANAMVQACPLGNCPPVDNLISGSVPLTQSLVTNVAAIGSLNPDDVVPYLAANLTWTASLMNDSIVPVAGLANLQISVLGATVTIPSDPSEFPVYGTYNTYTNATSGKTGGVYNA